MEMSAKLYNLRKAKKIFDQLQQMNKKIKK